MLPSSTLKNSMGRGGVRRGEGGKGRGGVGRGRGVKTSFNQTTSLLICLATLLQCAESCLRRSEPITLVDRFQHRRRILVRLIDK